MPSPAALRRSANGWRDRRQGQGGGAVNELPKRQFRIKHGKLEYAQESSLTDGWGVVPCGTRGTEGDCQDVLIISRCLPLPC